jgi:nucleotide-binding universal stress UspA family protein
MSDGTLTDDRRVALVALDGSPAAAEAIDIGARLLPALTARIAYVWTPPFASAEVRGRLLRRAGNLSELIALVEREGASEAERLAADGVTLARAAGWAAEPLIHRSYAGEGLELARLAEREDVTALVLGSRGLSGAPRSSAARRMQRCTTARFRSWSSRSPCLSRSAKRRRAVR